MRDKYSRDEIERCDTCGGVLDGVSSDHDFIARCSCPTRKGLKARAYGVGRLREAQPQLKVKDVCHTVTTRSS